jgi:hypothetical protein
LFQFLTVRLWLHVAMSQTRIGSKERTLRVFDPGSDANLSTISESLFSIVVDLLEKHWKARIYRFRHLQMVRKEMGILSQQWQADRMADEHQTQSQSEYGMLPPF